MRCKFCGVEITYDPDDREAWVDDMDDPNCFDNKVEENDLFAVTGLHEPV